MPSAKKRQVDYRSSARKWGHNIEMFKWKSNRKEGATTLGWGSLKKGDEVIIDFPSPNGVGKVDVVFTVRSVKYFQDPQDMFKADLVDPIMR